jgi:hypothetical protein
MTMPTDARELIRELSQMNIFGIRLLNGTITVYNNTDWDIRKFNQARGAGATVGELRELVRQLK